MPELPEVETVKTGLNKLVTGKKIKDVVIKVSKLIKNQDVEFVKSVIGKKIKAVRRRAKLLIIDLTGGKSIIVHLKMTGQLVFRQNGRLIAGGHPINTDLTNLPNKYTHVYFIFTDKSCLFFNDLRKFGWLKLIETDDVELYFQEQNFGPEPLAEDFSSSDFQQILKKRPNRKIKQLLMDPQMIAGIGNIYSDEALFYAGISPFRPAGQISVQEAKKLYSCLRKILKKAVAKGGSSIDMYVNLQGEKGDFVKFLKVYGRQGQSCYHCQSPIIREKIGGRSAHYCPVCQK